MNLCVMTGAGNTFAVADAGREALPKDRAEFARGLCADPVWRERGIARLDGLLVVSPGIVDVDCRMQIYNADGSSPEACGNGLRCVARFARERGYTARDRMRIETDVGVREVEIVRDDAGEISAVRARMGAPCTIERDVVLQTSFGPQPAILVDMGNPHCVLLIDDERNAPVETLGRELEHHQRFPARTNVEFAALRQGQLHLRVWERGVGETAACGTGACATAVAASLEGLVSLPVEIELPGGRLGVEWDGHGEVVLIGPCGELWRGEHPVEIAR